MKAPEVEVGKRIKRLREDALIAAAVGDFDEFDRLEARVAALIDEPEAGADPRSDRGLEEGDLKCKE